MKTFSQRRKLVLGLTASLFVTVSAVQASQTMKENILYAACYTYDPGDKPVVYFPVQKTTQWHVFYNFAYQFKKRVQSDSGYESADCKFGRTEAEAEANRVKSGYVEVARSPWPKGFMPSAPGDKKVAEAKDKSEEVSELEAGKEKAEKSAVATNKSTSVPVEPPTPKYVEVTGPHGTKMRLSAEVAARNKAAAEEHARKMEAHERAQTVHERKMAEFQESLAKAAAAKKDYENRLAQSSREAQAHHAAMNAYNKELGRGQTKEVAEGILQSYGAFSETREAAMASLLSRSKNKPELFDIQCSESSGGFKKSWACWGSYRQTMTRSGVSKQ